MSFDEWKLDLTGPLLTERQRRVSVLAASLTFVLLVHTASHWLGLCARLGLALDIVSLVALAGGGWLLTRGGSALAREKTRLWGRRASGDDDQAAPEQRAAPNRQPELVYSHDLEGNILSASPDLVALFDPARPDVAGMNLAEVVDPRHLLFFWGLLDEVAQGGQPARSYDVLTYGRGGRAIWLRVWPRLVRVDGEPAYIAGRAEEITEYKAQADARPSLAARASDDITDDASGDAGEAKRLGTPPELRATRALRSDLGWSGVDAHTSIGQIFASLGEAVVVVDRETRVIVSCNPAVERILGYTGKEIIGRRTTMMHVNESSWERFYQSAETVLAARDEFHTEYRLRRKDGTLFDSEHTVRLIRDTQGEPVGYVSIVRDIAEKKSLQAQLLQAQKMEAVGRLAGGVAHDFNNLLTVINGYGELIMSTMPPTDPIYEDLKEIRAAGQRAQHLTRQLLAFSRRQLLEPRVINLNDVLEGMAKMLRRIIGEDVHLALDPAPDLWQVHADPGQIEQVVTNLAVNARDAMPTGGVLSLQTENIEIDAADILRHLDLEPGDYVCITVSDTGHGMTDEVLEHLFEPFFTTKPANKGTGLGLATVYGIVKQSGGGVGVYSEPGRGATFRIYLPRAEQDPIQCEFGDGAADEVPSGDETVLVIEDDHEVRGCIVRMLEDLGYGVIEAADGCAALSLDDAPPPDLLLVDTILPGLSGPQLLTQLRARYGRVPMLRMSGHSDHVLVDETIAEMGDRFLQKPFGMAQLARRVRHALDA
jgi:PAS domain S-box-containing protein